MQHVPEPTNLTDFPSHIVPAATVSMSKIYDEVAKIDARINNYYAKLEDIKNKQGEKSKAYNTYTKKVQEAEAEKKAIYEENPQWKWAQQWVDALIGYGISNYTTRDQLMYSYLEARVNEGEFSHVTELYAGEKALPAYIRQVNRCPAIANRICGEADSTGLRYSVSAINSDAVNSKLDAYASEMADKLTKYMRQKGGLADVLGQPLEDGDTWATEMPPFEDMSFNTYTTPEEVMVKRGLDYLMRKPDAAIKYKLIHKGLRNYVATGKMAFEITAGVDDPDIISIDSRDLFFILNDTSPFIQHGTGAGRYFAATPQDVIDMAPELPADEVHQLKGLVSAYNGGTGRLGQLEIDRAGCFVVRVKDKVRPLYMHCWRVKWMATKRVRVKVIENKFDEENPYLKYVGDNESDESANYEYRYVQEQWEAYKFGNIYYQMRPVPGQHLVGDYVEKKSLDIVGIIDPNPSIIELAQPFEALRIQAFYALERLMAQVQGKILCVDEANESDDADNAYNMKVYSVYRYNSAKEGDQQLMSPNGSKNMNKPEVLDLGLSSAVTDLINFLRFLDINVDAITGINDARRGAVKSDTGLGQMQVAGAASAMATQPYLTAFYTVVGQALQKMCEVMQRSWGGKDIVKYFLGEDGMQLLRFMSESEWHLARYGVFIENGANDAEVQKNIFNLAQTLMPIQAEPDLSLALIKMMNANSAKEAEQIYEKGVKALNKIKQQAQQGAAQQAQQQQQMFLMQEDNKTLRERIKSLEGPLAVEKMKQDGKKVQTEIKNEFNMDKQDVTKQDKIDLAIAENEIEKNRERDRAFTDALLNKE